MNPIGCFPLQPASPIYTYVPPPTYGGPYSAPYSKVRMASDTHVGDNFNAPSEVCIQRFDDYSLSCALPYEQRAPSSEVDCQNLCSEGVQRCKSFQFDSTTAVCAIFDVTPRSEAQAPSPPASPFKADAPPSSSNLFQKACDRFIYLHP